MALAKYLEMKDSHVSWIGSVPNSWKVVPVRYLFQPIKRVVGDTASEFELLSLTRRGIIPRSEVAGGKNPANYDTYQIAQPDDLVMCLFDYDVTPRTVGYVKQEGMVTGAYTVLQPKKNVSSQFYYYFFLALDETKELLHLCTGLRNGLSKPTFFGLNIPAPDLETQQKIAGYLDAETAKIDHLVERQEKLLALLEEKRRATITHAVTRGLDPNVELKETNIPWLGKIPAHWSAVRIAALYRRKRIKNYPNEELLSVYRDHGVIVKSSRDDNHNTESEDLSGYQLVEPKDLVTNKMKTWQGSIAVSELRGIVSPAYFIFSPINQLLLPKYVHYQLRSDRYIAQYKSISKGIRPGQWDLDYEQFRLMRLTLPPADEQSEIVKHIEDNEIKTKLIKQKIRTQITLLRERRTSLISHAVTGKINV